MILFSMSEAAFFIPTFNCCSAIESLTQVEVFIYLSVEVIERTKRKLVLKKIRNG